VQSVLALIVPIIKSIIIREIFEKHKEIKYVLWGENLWTREYYVNILE